MEQQLAKRPSFVGSTVSDEALYLRSVNAHIPQYSVIKPR
jgi:hypothetical protein